MFQSLCTSNVPQNPQKDNTDEPFNKNQAVRNAEVTYAGTVPDVFLGNVSGHGDD